MAPKSSYQGQARMVNGEGDSGGLDSGSFAGMIRFVLNLRMDGVEAA